MMSLQFCLHYGQHLLIPVLWARLFFPAHCKAAYLYMLATMLMDMDHLFATPVFDPQRCSIGFHPLHTGYAAAGYVLLAVVPRWQARAIALGCLYHLWTDWVDCWFIGK